MNYQYSGLPGFILASLGNVIKSFNNVNQWVKKNLVLNRVNDAGNCVFQHLFIDVI